MNLGVSQEGDTLGQVIAAQRGMKLFLADLGQHKEDVS